jgi:hypothetical protein
VYAFVVPGVALIASAIEALPKPSTRVLVDLSKQPVDDLAVTNQWICGPSVPTRPRQSDCPASVSSWERVLPHQYLGGPGASQTDLQFSLQYVLDRVVLQRQVGVHALEFRVL